MRSRRELVAFTHVLLACVAADGCSAVSEPPAGGPGRGIDAAAERTEPPLPIHDASADSEATPDASGTPNDAQGEATDGPFGLSGRAAKQTCVPPANFRQPAATLSATGCVDANDPKKPAASLIPYDVNSALWSDGADKQRFLALPDGAVIHVKDCQREPATCASTDDDGHWQLPVGTVLMKSFLFAGKFVETRLFVRFADRWTGYSYGWDDAQTDATIVGTDGDTKTLPNASGQTQTWSFPSRGGCLECHNDAAGGSLGLETMQLDRKLRYPSGVEANQIATLEHIGAFDAPVPRSTPLVDPRLPDPSDLDARARSYLHANCSMCHRPAGPFNGLDLRVNVPLSEMRICNAAPQKGDQGVPGAKLLVPQMPDKSIVYLRMQAADKAAGRMPTLASSVLDDQGLALMSEWIQATTACP
jgi:uncharacterized repeat protein (TIGR03806 family)